MKYPVFDWIDDKMENPDVKRIIKRLDDSNSLIQMINDYQNLLIRKLQIKIMEEASE